MAVSAAHATGENKLVGDDVDAKATMTRDGRSADTRLTHARWMDDATTTPSARRDRWGTATQWSPESERANSRTVCPWLHMRRRGSSSSTTVKEPSLGAAQLSKTSARVHASPVATDVLGGASADSCFYLERETATREGGEAGEEGVKQGQMQAGGESKNWSKSRGAARKGKGV